MINKIFIVLFLFFSFSYSLAQEDSLLVPVPQEPVLAAQESEPYDALAPARAAFYSAVLPGLGQAYNKKYWKIPIAYGGLAAGIYFYNTNQKQYTRYRNIYKRRLAGFTDDEFVIDGVVRVTNEGLIRAQRVYQRNKEISILVTVGVYALNIIDANIDAHLRQFNVSEDLSLTPAFEFDEYTGKNRYGLSLNFNF